MGNGPAQGFGREIKYFVNLTQSKGFDGGKKGGNGFSRARGCSGKKDLFVFDNLINRLGKLPLAFPEIFIGKA